MPVLGLDIGGANLKAAHENGTVRYRPFALWNNPDRLPGILAELLADMPGHDRIALTMTGELCDCFDNKRQGVLAIVAAVKAVAGDRPIGVWTTNGFVDVAVVCEQPLPAASANWLALATFAGRWVAGHGVVIDIGSTTTDLIPIAAGCPVPKGFTDSDRLRSLELVYTGVRRTPLCAILGAGVAAELFATMLDVHLVLGTLAEEAANQGTADGRPATIAAAHARLARMMLADPDTCDRQDIRKLAERALLRQVDQLTMAFDQVVKTLPGSPTTVVLAGEGEFLARLLLNQHNSFRGGQVISLADHFTPEISRAACAYAVAVLAQEKGL